MRGNHRLRRHFECKAASRLSRTTPNMARLAAAVLLALGVVAPAHSADFIVNDAGDSGPGTLRQAVLDANATGGPHTISFALPSGSTIMLMSGQIALTGPEIAIQGPGRDELIISGNHHSRIFDVEAGSLTLNDITLRDGLAQGDATNSYDEVGGAIRVGALPPPLPPGEFAARLAAARHWAQVAAAGGHNSARRANRKMLQWMGSLQPASTPPLSLTLDHVALLDNRADAPALAVGGAVALFGGADLVMRASVVSGNSTPYGGGGIAAIGAADLYGGNVGAGSFDIRDSLFTGNHIDQNGTQAGQGAAMVTYGPGGTISRSVFSGNMVNDAPPEQDFSEGIGGALTLVIANLPISIADSEISDNTIVLRAGAFSEGAGLFCQNDYFDTTPLTISNTTISGNQSEHGAAIEASCNLQLINSTISGNIAGNNSVPGYSGGGDAIEMIHNEGIFNATSTLIFNPAAARADFYAYLGATNIGTVSKSLIFAPDSSTPPLPPDTLIGVDPLLAPLTNNGGPTRTQALLADSPAIDAGSNTEGVAFDQRGAGFTRVVGVAADIGAFEYNPDRILTNGFE